MAELRVFDNIFENKCKNRFYSETFDIKEEVSKFADDNVYQDTLVECYDEETGETFFAPLSDDTNTDSVLVLANGKSVDFNYVPKSTDIVSVVFLPLSNTKGGWQWGGFGLGALSGALIGFFCGVATLNPAVMLIGAAVGAVVGGIVGAICGGVFYDKMKVDTNSSYDTGKDGEKLPDVRGAENQALTGNSFPFVIGKHLVTPFVIGNPYTTYEGENGQDAVIREVLAVGYAPLKLTDFKLGDVWLAYNRTMNGTERASVLNGKLTPDTKLTSAEMTFIKNENTIGDFIKSVCPLLNTDNHKEKVLSLAGTITVLTSTESFSSITIKESDTKGFNTVSINSVEFSGNLDDPLPYNIKVTAVKTQNDSNADGDILSYWKNNDVEIEILQQHPDKPVDYGDIYPAKAVDTDVNANLLYVIDGDIEEVAKKKNIVYKNQGFINGLRTNRVQFTEACPLEFTVNLDMPSGLYSQWSWDGKTTYGKIPLWVALQWRFYSENNGSSKEDGSDSANWHNFLPSGSDEYADYSSNFKGELKDYDADMIAADILAHEGNSFSDSSVSVNLNTYLYNKEAISVIKKAENIPQTRLSIDIKCNLNGFYFQQKVWNSYTLLFSWRTIDGIEKSRTFNLEPWYDGSAYELHNVEKKEFKTDYGTFLCVNDTVTIKSEGGAEYKRYDTYLFADQDFYIENSSYKGFLDGNVHFYWDEKKVSGTRYITNFLIKKQDVKTVSYITEAWGNSQLLNFESYSGEDGISEMRASFTCKLNVAGCEKIISDGTNKIKGIEVRAIRVSPNYLNMTSSWGKDDKGSPKQYSDSIIWQSLVTKTFNEDKLTALLERQTAGYVDATDEYILSQIPEKNLSESDLRKLCVVAIKAKADVNGTLQQQLKKINCVAESFSPVYDDESNRWFPMDVHKETGYYKPAQDSAGNSDGWTEVTKEQYEEARGKGLSWKKEAKGSCFADDMLRFVLNTKDNNGRNVLTALHSRFNENNAISGFLLAAVGAQNGAAAVGYEDLNMLSLADGYVFCEAVTDGSTYSKDTTDNSGLHLKGSPVVVKFSANAYLYQQQKLEDLLKKLAICARAVVTYDSCGRLQLVVDKKDDYPKGVINQQNCVSGTNTYSWSELPAGLQFSFSDENDGYETNQVYCWADNNSLKSYKGQVQSYGIDYVTNPAQLWSLGRYVLACMLLQREVLTRKIGTEGELFSLGDTVLVQDSSLLLGDGSARIQEVIEDSQYIYGFITDSVFEYRGEVEDGKCKQGVTVLQPAQFGKSRTVTLRLAVPGSQVIDGDSVYTMTKGSTNICLLEEKIQKIGNGDPSDSGSILKCHFKTDNIVMFGDYTLISQKYRITKIKPEQDGTYTETLLPYFDELYEYGAPLPSFQSPVKMPAAEKDPFSLSEVPDNIADQNKNISNIVENVTATISKKIDKTPPTPPVLTDITSDDEGNITLVWAGSTDTESGVAEYCIYHKTAGGRFARIQTVPHDDSSQSQYTYTHITADKFTSHYYYITAKDKMSNESEPSETLSIKNPVKTLPNVPSNLTVAAYENYIALRWTAEQSASASLNPRLFKVEIKRNDESQWVEAGENTSGEMSYYFDRETDGYPEAGTVSAYKFRVKSVSVYGLESEWCTLESVDTGSYLGWKIGEVNVSAYATEGMLYIKAGVEGSSYGEKRLSVKYGGVSVADNVSAGRLFYYRLEGYQEAADITAKDIAVRCTSVADSVEKSLSGSEIDVSLYKTYKITKPNVTAYADKQGIHISWSDNSNDYYLNPVYTLRIDGADVLSSKDVLSFDSLFAEDTYPLKADVAATEIKLTVSTDADSVEIADIPVDVSVFKDWIPEVPELKLSVSGRTVPLSWNMQTDNVYDFLGCDIQVAKGYKTADGKYAVITDESELEWFAPALGLNPYESLDNYKKGDKDGYLSVKGTSVAFSVPLFGQDTDGALSTMYVYRARAFTKGGKSEWSDAYFAEVKPVSAYDVVKAWDINDSGEKVKIDGALGANQIFVNELSAICANLGYITDGALQTDSFNYWAVNDTLMKDGSVLAKGSFRVGGADEYLEVSPVLDDNGIATGDYTLKIVAQKFSTTTNVTILNNKLFLVRDKDNNILFKAGVYEKDPDAIDDYGLADGDDKNYIRVNEGYYTSKKVRNLAVYPASMRQPVIDGSFNILYMSMMAASIIGNTSPIYSYKGKIYYVTLGNWFTKISDVYDPYFIDKQAAIYSVDSNNSIKKEFSIPAYPAGSPEDNGLLPCAFVSFVKEFVYYFEILYKENDITQAFYRINLDTGISEELGFIDGIADIIKSYLESSVKDTNFFEYRWDNLLYISFTDEFILCSYRTYSYQYKKEASDSSFQSGKNYYDKDGNLVSVTQETYKSGTYYTRESNGSGEVYFLVDIINKKAIKCDEDVFSHISGWNSDDDYLYFCSIVTFGTLVTRVNKTSLQSQYCRVTISRELNTMLDGKEDTEAYGMFLQGDSTIAAKGKFLKLIKGIISFVGTYTILNISDDGSSIEKQVYTGILEVRNPIWTDSFDNIPISTLSIYGENIGTYINIYKTESRNEDIVTDALCYLDKNIYIPLVSESKDFIFASKARKSDDLYTYGLSSIFRLKKIEQTPILLNNIEILGVIEDEYVQTDFKRTPLRPLQILNVKQLADDSFFVYAADAPNYVDKLQYGFAYKTDEWKVGVDIQRNFYISEFQLKDEFVTTNKNTYETGIGFSGFYKDVVTKNYRYLLASGAYLEFDESGKLVTDNRGDKGDKGDTGDKGAKGDKGDKGDAGTSVSSVKQTETSTAPGGVNKLEITLSDGTKSEFSVRNGSTSDDDIVLTDDDFTDILK